MEIKLKKKKKFIHGTKRFISFITPGFCFIFLYPSGILKLQVLLWDFSVMQPAVKQKILVHYKGCFSLFKFTVRV